MLYLLPLQKAGIKGNTLQSEFNSHVLYLVSYLGNSADFQWSLKLTFLSGKRNGLYKLGGFIKDALISLESLQ